MNDDEIDARLRHDGARWRARQVFGDVEVSPSRSRDPWQTIAGALAVAAIGVATLVIGLPQLGQKSGDPPLGSPTGQPTMIFPTLRPDEVEAAQIVVIEAVNADPAHFGGVYVDEAGDLVIQYLGDNEGRAAVEQLIVPGLTVSWEKVERTQEDLIRITREISELDLPGVFSVSVDTVANEVDVLVGPGGSTAEVSLALEAYGDVVNITYSEDAIVH